MATIVFIIMMTICTGDLKKSMTKDKFFFFLIGKIDIKKGHLIIYSQGRKNGNQRISMGK